MPLMVTDASRAQRDVSSEMLRKACAESDPAQARRLRERVVLENRALAAGIARQFEGKGVERDDLAQVAMLGLVLAAERYRPGIGHGFVAFAVPTITGELKRYFRDHGWAVRPPRGLQELHGQVRQASEDLAQLLQRAPTNVEVARHLDVSVDAVRQARLVDEQYRATSLDTPPRGALESALGEAVVDDQDPYDQVVALVSLRSAMHRLDRRERIVLRLRFVDNLTQRQIGRRIGVSQMQVSRLLRDIYTELRASIDGRSR